MANETLLNNQLYNETFINPEVHEDNFSTNETILNPELNEDSYSTLLNPELSDDNANTTSSNETLLNSDLNESSGIIGNSIGEFIIKQKLDVFAGEADLYLCEKESSQYVLKLYRREQAIKDEVIEKLKSIDSPYIARIVDTGVIDSHPYEITPYYKNGNLLGKRYTYDELRETIIPQINEALKILHENKIYHKDIKPTNIMLCDNGKDVVVIDFGISSLTDDGNTILLTKTGFTPEYTAHEAFLGLFLPESDYYSMGITLYELYTGTTPYRGMDMEKIEQYISVQKIPLPENMDPELKNLISALTYSDITNRKDKTNPNRRWMYDEVWKWLNSEDQPIPGNTVYEESSSTHHASEIGVYLFNNKEYTDRHNLAIAFAKNWDDAKRELFNGLLSGHFKSIDQAFASTCVAAEEAYGTGVNSDLLLFKVLYQLDPSLTNFLWKGEQFLGLDSLGREIQNHLRKNGKVNTSFFTDILRHRVISEYLLAMGNSTDEMKNSIAAVETIVIQYPRNKRLILKNLHLLGYMLSNRKTFYKDEHEFASVNELILYLSELMNNSLAKFEEYSLSLIDENNELDVQLESWLIACGKESLINNWLEQLRK